MQAFLVLLLLGLTFAAHHDDSALFAMLFRVVDVNKDGGLNAPELNTVFHNYDTDGDGSVSQVEFATSLGHRSQHLKEDAPELFHEFDVNKDGKITTNDLIFLFAKMDSNGSGTVAAFEFSQFFEQALKAAGHFDHDDEGEEEEE